jgi:crotonobetainyl-CoA:carnitine CoA-transferase CaiB-like acyl-CoA transferase
VGALEPKFWNALCHALQCEQFIADQFAEGARRAEIIARVTQIFETRPSAEWIDLLAPHDACIAPVQNMAEVMHEFDLGIGDTVVIPKLSATPGSLGEAAPRLGAHTEEILSKMRR